MDAQRGGFSLFQLMELAGLSVAEAAFSLLQAANTNTVPPNVIIVCGPGNNGGDGLVAARHLTHFGVRTSVFLPKLVARDPFVGLVRQLECLGVPFLKDQAELDTLLRKESSVNLLVDAIFGFSFKGDIRAPFDTILKSIKAAKHVPILSVDVPSGWDVDEGNTSGLGLEPKALISLTAPKPCSKGFKGRHFVGGRFIPPDVQKEFGIDIPQYHGSSMAVEIVAESVV
ncbi:YjeF N-terminal domain-containing protein [Chytriomyces sp. MP71]|nr:YjeF N-terminal domain-containing protein [Chytriomyces sp. MP71]